MHRILFVDVTCPKPYDGNTLRTLPQGGSESTLTRVAEALAERGHRVRVAQHNRTERADVYGVEHVPIGQIGDFEPTHVVAFREARLLERAREHWPAAKGYAWYHDFPIPRAPFAAEARALARTGGTALLVSDWHQGLFVDYLRAFGLDGRVATRRLYNAIPDDLHPDDTPVDRDKFVFFSSPHKGLPPTLQFLSRLREHPELREVRLHVANPGYRDGLRLPDDGSVVELGPLPWARVIHEVRGAFLVLHYNYAYPETFGIVHAEANAVGTPWIGGTLGANPEVCAHPEEMADLGDPQSVIDRIVRWRTEGRPTVRGSEEFRISRVADAWEALLAEAPADGGGPRAPRHDAASAEEAGVEDALVVHAVDRAEVEAGDTGAAAAFLARASADRDALRAHQGRIDLCFSGWEGDAREAWTIPEVHAWLRALDARVPSWFWLLTARPASDALLAVMLAHCDHAPAANGRPAVEPEARSAFLVSHFDRLHETARQAGLWMAGDVRICRAVARYYAARLAPPDGG